MRVWSCALGEEPCSHPGCWKGMGAVSVLGDSALRGESRIVVLEADQEPNKEESWRASGWGSVGGGGSDAELLGRYRNC